MFLLVIHIAPSYEMEWTNFQNGAKLQLLLFFKYMLLFIQVKTDIHESFDFSPQVSLYKILALVEKLL